MTTEIYEPAPDILYDEDGRCMAIRFELVDTPRAVLREVINVNEYVIDDMGYYTDDDVSHIRLSSYRGFVQGIRIGWYRRGEHEDEQLGWGPNTWVPQGGFENLDARFIKYWVVPE